MTNQPPLNPDTIHQLFAVAMMEVLDAEKLQPGNRLAHVNDIQEVLNRLEKNVLAVAQPVVNNVESIPAKMRMLMWEGGEVEVGEIPDGFVLVGFEMETDRAWSMADKVTINIERPEVKP